MCLRIARLAGGFLSKNSFKSSSSIFAMDISVLSHTRGEFYKRVASGLVHLPEPKAFNRQTEKQCQLCLQRFLRQLQRFELALMVPAGSIGFGIRTVCKVPSSKLTQPMSCEEGVGVSFFRAVILAALARAP